MKKYRGSLGVTLTGGLAEEVSYGVYSAVAKRAY